MSIDKDSSGFPQVNVHKRTSKVNLWMIASVLVFFAVTAAVAVWVSRRSAAPDAITAPV